VCVCVCVCVCVSVESLREKFKKTDEHLARYGASESPFFLAGKVVHALVSVALLPISLFYL